MRRKKTDLFSAVGRQRSVQTLLAVAVVYLLLLLIFESPFFFPLAGAGAGGVSLPRLLLLKTEHGRLERPGRPRKRPSAAAGAESGGLSIVSGLMLPTPQAGGASEIEKSAREAWELGARFWGEAELGVAAKKTTENQSESCPSSISLSGAELDRRGKIMELPCGLTLGSHITLVGKPCKAHEEFDPKISILKEGAWSAWVSQFMVELQGLKTVEGEDPPKILHFNPRLKGDWSGRPVIEQNTCYRMQWGSALRCEGWKSKADEETGTCLFSDSYFFLFVALITQNSRS